MGARDLREGQGVDRAPRAGGKVTSSPFDPDVPSLRDAVSPLEWQARIELATRCRLVALPGWDDLVLLQRAIARLGKTQRLHSLRAIDALPDSPIGKVLRREPLQLHGPA